MVSGCPFLIQVTLVAGEPVETQVTLGDVNPLTDVMLGGAGEEHNTIAMKLSSISWSALEMNGKVVVEVRVGVKI